MATPNDFTSIVSEIYQGMVSKGYTGTEADLAVALSALSDDNGATTKWIDLGASSAYAIAVEHGYTGTEEEWIALLMDITQNAQIAKDSAESAAESAASARQSEEAIPAKKEAALQAIASAESDALQSVNTAGITQTGNVNTAGQTQVQAVNAAGTTQIGLVQQEGSDQKDVVIAEGEKQTQRVSSQGILEVQAVANEGTRQTGLVTDEGDTQVARVTAEGTTQVGLVTAEGTTQVTAVQDKGDEVLASIPADYSALTQNVSSLESALSLGENWQNSVYGATFTKFGNVIQIDGAPTNSEWGRMYNFFGQEAYGAASSISSWTSTLQVKKGNKYRFHLKKISGTANYGDTPEAGNKGIYIPVYRQGTTSRIAGSTMYVNDETDEISFDVTWTYDENPVVCFAFLAKNASFTKAVYKVWVEDVTNENETEGIEEKYSDQIANVYASSDYYRGGGSGSWNKHLTLMLISDTHYDYEAVRNAIDLSERMDAVDAILHLGDTSAATTPAKGGTSGLISEAVSVKTITKPFFVALGNHDAQLYADSSLYSDVEESVAMIMPHLNTSASYTQRGYGYYDFSDYKVRLIILNAYDYPDDVDANGSYHFYGVNILYQQDQIDFVINALENLPTGYTVIIASHFAEGGEYHDEIINRHMSSSRKNNPALVGSQNAMSGNVISDIIAAFKSKSTINKSYTYSQGDYSGTVNAEGDFSNSSGYIAGFVCGHTHQSAVVKSSVGDYWIYVHDTSACGTPTQSWTSAYSNIPRAENTKTRDLITCLSIDTENRILKFARIGAHINRFLEDDNFTVLNF